MDRRECLTGSVVATAGLTGCLALPDGGTPIPDRTVAIVERDALPDLPVEPSIEVTHAAATADGPPELRARVENTADYPVEVGEERAIVFAFVSSQESPGLTLLPVDTDANPVEAGCWRLAEPIALAEYYGIVRLAPVDEIERTLRVWGSPDGDRCLPVGQFRLETEFAGARDRTEGLDEQEWRGRWGFTLEVS